MSELKATKGPWRVGERYTPSTDVLDEGGFAIAEASSTAILEDYEAKLGVSHWARSNRAFRELDTAEAEANAHLIAAAPSMYEALDRACWGCVSSAASDEDGERVNLNMRLSDFKMIEAALSKARGEQA